MVAPAEPKHPDEDLDKGCADINGNCPCGDGTDFGCEEGPVNKRCGPDPNLRRCRVNDRCSPRPERK